MIDLIILESDISKVFDTKNTNMSYYNDFLRPDDLKYLQRSKNKTGEIVMMSPFEYFHRCSRDIFAYNASISDLENSRRASSYYPKYVEAMRNGETFPMPMLDYTSHGQEGLHRMLAAADVFGWHRKFPVLVVDYFDKEIAEEQKFAKQIDAYFTGRYPDDVKKVQDVINDKYNAWNDTPPLDFTKILQQTLYDITDKKVKARVYVEYEDVGPDELFPVFVHFEPIEYCGKQVADYLDTKYLGKRNYLFIEDMFNTDIDDGYEMTIYEDAEVDDI